MEKLLTKKDVLEVLEIKESTLYTWVHRKKIPYIKLGKRCLRFRENDILQWIADKAVRPCIAEECHKAKKRQVPSKPLKADNDIERLVNNAKKDILKK